MNYKKLYNKLIENRKQNPILTGYTELHHITPRSIGGSDSTENLVKLTAREHYIAHALLAEIYEKESHEWYKMNHAFMMMRGSNIHQERYYNSRYYDLKKKDFSKVMSYNQSGEKNSQHGKIWLKNPKTYETKSINLLFLDDYLKDGWEKGRFSAPTKYSTLQIKYYMMLNNFKKDRLKRIKRKKKYFYNGKRFNQYKLATIKNKFGIDIKECGFEVFKSKLVEEYHTNKLSLPLIGKKYGINQQTVLNYMQDFGIETRDVGSPQGYN